MSKSEIKKPENPGMSFGVASLKSTGMINEAQYNQFKAFFTNKDGINYFWPLDRNLGTLADENPELFNARYIFLTLLEIAERWGVTAKGQLNLAEAYYYGRGTPQNYAEAMKWYHKAAEQGDAGAQYSLGEAYCFGTGVSQDYAEAIKWYRKAADQGNAWAQHNLGVAYYEGMGVPQNDAEAMKWWQKASRQGLAEAKHSLKLHDNRTLYRKVADWWRTKAAQ